MASQDNIQQYYEERYTKKSWGATKAALLRVHDNLQGMEIEPGARILDVGCGLGETGLYLRDRGAEALGLDISFTSVQAALQPQGYIAVLQANAEVLPFQSASFDGATFMGTLEHFIHPERSLREALRVLRPRAQLCFVVPNSQFFLFKFLGGTEQPYEKPRTYEGWCRLFASEGLVVEAVYRDVGPGIREGGLLRGLVRKSILLLSGLFPLNQTYQFVFICRRRDEERTGGAEE